MPLVVLHAEPRAAAKLAAFTNSTDPWIVAVNMVSEGVDIPRLRVGVYATAAKTPLIFRQIVGRFVRTLPGRPVEPSWLYVPADPVLRDHAATIEQELRRLCAAPARTTELEQERAERRETERSETPEFVPLSADVAPQMTPVRLRPPRAQSAAQLAPWPRPAALGAPRPRPRRVTRHAGDGAERARRRDPRLRAPARCSATSATGSSPRSGDATGPATARSTRG